MTDLLAAFLARFSQGLDEIYQKQPAFTERPYRAHGSHVIVGGSGSDTPAPRQSGASVPAEPQPAGV